jgi:hypothetical protein
MRGVVVFLAVGALAACGSPPARQPEQPRSTPTPPPEPAPCSTPERSPLPDTWFLYSGQRCGCWAGKLRCREPARQKCFLNGMWYSKFWAVESEAGQPRKRCVCNGTGWDCSDVNDVGVVLVRILFPLHQTELPASRESIDNWASGMREDSEGKLALIGVINTAEGERAEALARKRAEVVRDAFIERGVAPSRLSVAVKDGTSLKDASTVLFQPVLDPPE